MTKEAFIKGINEKIKPVEINKGLIIERNTKRVTNLSKNEKIYAQGDGLMKIAPFDNYYLFTIYSELNLENVPVDVHNMGSFFLTFKDKESEVRIENYKNAKEINPTNGQILFRISQEEAEKILSLNTNIFYITSMLYDSNSKSDETVLYSGRFAEYNDANVSFLTDEITNLKAELEKVKKEKLEKEAELQKQITNLSDALVKLRTEYSTLNNTLNSYKNSYNSLANKIKIDEFKTKKEQESEITEIDKTLQQNNLIQEFKKNENNKSKLDLAVGSLRKEIIGIKPSVINLNKNTNVNDSNITSQDAKMSLANITIKTGVVIVYAFMYTKYADLDTETEKSKYDSLDKLYKSTQQYINANKYNNIEYHIIYSETDLGKIMSKYNVNSDCILVTKNSKTIGKVYISDASTPTTIIQTVESIIDMNNTVSTPKILK